jgi:membrane protease YdiL (CAAX protease family)
MLLMSSPLSGSFRQSFIRMSPPVKILLLVLFISVLLLISSILAVLLAIPIFDLKMDDMVQIISYPDLSNIGVVKFFQIMESIFIFLVPALLAAWLFSENTVNYLKGDTRPSGITLLLVLCSLGISIPMMNVLSNFNSGMDLPVWMDSIERKIRAMEESAGRLTELFLVGNNAYDLVLNLIMIAILPALGEEFLFRGLLQRLFIEWTRNNHLGIWITAFVFSFIHFQFYGFLPRFLLGLYFGYLLVWSGSIWVPVTGHFINNGVAVIYYHFAAKPMGETPMDKLGTDPGNHVVLYLSVFFTAILIGLTFLREREIRALFR